MERQQQATVESGELSQSARRTSISTALSATLLWDYAEETSQVRSLYELAKEKAWNVARDVSWCDFSRLHNFPVDEDSNPLCGYPEYEALSRSERIRLSWWQHGLEISEILHGEQGALLIASQLVTCLPSMEAKLFASSQVFDEARHVEFFSRYLHEVVGTVHDPSDELKSLIQFTIEDPRWDMKFIACQILIESLAMAKFQEIKAKCLVPMMQFAISYIAKDEARHVKFGAEYLKQHVDGLSEAEREFRSEFVLDNVLKLANAMNIYTRIAEDLGWDVASLRTHLRKFRVQNPEINRARFRQLIINLTAVGLLTERTKERLSGMNLMV